MKIKITDILNFIASNLGFTPTGGVSATNVQAAIAEVDSEKVAKSGDTMAGDLVVDTGGTAEVTVGGNGFNVAGNGTAIANLARYDESTTCGVISLRKARGTRSSPTAINKNDLCFLITGQSYDGADFRTGMLIGGTVIEPTPSNTAMGTRISFEACRLGSLSRDEVMRLEPGTGFSMFGSNPVVDEDRIHRLRKYTVGTLPSAGTSGRLAAVTDANSPSYNGTVSGGGTIDIPVFDNGSNWTAH